MAVSPIELQRDLPTVAGARRTAAKAWKGDAPRPVAPGTRTVDIDLPEPLPGRLSLDLDRETGRVVARIVDKQSGRLIRQVPTDEALRLAASVQRMLEPLFRETA